MSFFYMLVHLLIYVYSCMALGTGTELNLQKFLSNLLSDPKSFKHKRKKNLTQKTFSE